MPIISNFPVGGGGASGGGLALGACTNIATLTASGKVYVKWTDPEDLVVAGSTLASWSGTLLVRKAGSMPVSRRDGTVVLDSKTRNAYQDTYFCDSGLSDGTTYYYKFFSYTTTSTYTESDDNGFAVTPNPVETGNVTGIKVAATLNGRVQINWTDPAATVVSDGVTLATWASTKVVYKEGGYPTSPDDGTLALNSTTRNAYSSTPLEVTGLTNGTTYYFGFFPISTDGAVNTNTASGVTAVPNRIKLTAVPAQSGTLTYNGNAQSPTWSNYNSAQLTIGGVTSQTNAGSYNATFTPTNDYCWSDGSTTAQTVAWSIGKATISVPTTSSSFTYDGDQKTPVWTGYDSAKMTLGGTSSATNAGTYTATFTPTSNYQWGDGTTTAKNVSWSIAKAAGSLNINPTTMTLNATTLTGTIAVTRVGDGEISAVSSNTGVATVSISGTTVTVRSVNETTGTATITISVAAGTNHLAPANKTCAVTAQFLPDKKTLENTTWAELSQIAKAGKAADYMTSGGGSWAIGDTKSMTFNGTTYYAQLIGIDHDTPSDTATYGQAKAGMTFQFGVANNSSMAGMFATYYPMNSSNTNAGGWTNCVMRTSTMSTMKGYMPTDLQNVLVAVNKLTSAGSQSSTINTTSDELFLLSEIEIFGSTTYSFAGEGTQYAFYSAGNSRVRYNASGSAYYWWERSPRSSNSTTFCTVHYSGNANTNYASNSYGVSFGFCI